MLFVVKVQIDIPTSYLRSVFRPRRRGKRSRKILLSEKNVCYGIIRRALSWNSIRTEISHVLSLNFKIFLIIW